MRLIMHHDASPFIARTGSCVGNPRAHVKQGPAQTLKPCDKLGQQAGVTHPLGCRQEKVSQASSRSMVPPDGSEPDRSSAGVEARETPTTFGHREIVRVRKGSLSGRCTSMSTSIPVGVAPVWSLRFEQGNQFVAAADSRFLVGAEEVADVNDLRATTSASRHGRSGETFGRSGVHQFQRGTRGVDQLRGIRSEVPVTARAARRTSCTRSGRSPEGTEPGRDASPQVP